MPRITCPYCRVQYGHEWWCCFKRMWYQYNTRKFINRIVNQTLACTICGRREKLCRPNQKPSHYLWCPESEKVSWNSLSTPVPLSSFKKIQKLARQQQELRMQELLDEEYGTTIQCIFCWKEVLLKDPRQPASHFWWCRFKRLRLWLTGE